MSNHRHSSSSSSSSSFPSCFRSTGTAANHQSTAAVTPPISGNPNLTTCLYHTELGLFALTWSRNLFGRSFHLHLLLDNLSSTTTSDDFSLPSLSSPSFHLHIRPFIFWNKHGSKKLTTTTNNVYIFWDLSRARFGSGPEPESGFYIAVVVDGEMTLLSGDSAKEAYSKTKAKKSGKPQIMVLRREHVYGNKLYTTKSMFGGKSRDISIDCRLGDDPKLSFSVDNKRVLQIKHLKWKFRGNERVEVDGVHIHLSWDVHNWLFEDEEDGYALFMFRFEKLGFEEGDDRYLANWNHEKNSYGFGFETKKMMKGLLKPARSSSSTASSSLSSASSSCSSVMEWASVEENELKGPSGFSLLVYAWKG